MLAPTDLPSTVLEKGEMGFETLRQTVSKRTIVTHTHTQHPPIKTHAVHTTAVRVGGTRIHVNTVIGVITDIWRIRRSTYVLYVLRFMINPGRMNDESA